MITNHDLGTFMVTASRTSDDSNSVEAPPRDKINVPLSQCPPTQSNHDIEATSRAMVQQLRSYGLVAVRAGVHAHCLLSRIKQDLEQAGLPAEGPMRISNVDHGGKPWKDRASVGYLAANSEWHHDRSFALPDIAYTLLLAEQVREGAATELLPAHLRVPAAVRSFLRRRSAYHIQRAHQGSTFQAPLERPILRVDPDSGIEVTCIGAHAYRLGSLTPRVSTLAFKALSLLQQSQVCSLSHEWENGDLLMWNNYRFLHRSADPATAEGPRTLQRVTFVLPG